MHGVTCYEFYAKKELYIYPIDQLDYITFEKPDKSTFRRPSGEILVYMKDGKVYKVDEVTGL